MPLADSFASIPGNRMMTVEMSEANWAILRADLMLAGMQLRETGETALSRDLYRYRGEIIRQVFPTMHSEE
jgi:hypothetical protein